MQYWPWSKKVAQKTSCVVINVVEYIAKRFQCLEEREMEQEFMHAKEVAGEVQQRLNYLAQTMTASGSLEECAMRTTKVQIAFTTALQTSENSTQQNVTMNKQLSSIRDVARREAAAAEKEEGSIIVRRKGM